MQMTEKTLRNSLNKTKLGNSFLKKQYRIIKDHKPNYWKNI